MINSPQALLMRMKVFSTLKAGELEKIAPKFSLHTFKKGQTLVKHSEHSYSVYFLYQGDVRATLYSPSGKQVSYQDLKPGDMFGEMSAIDQLPRSTHVIALTDGGLLSVSGEDFMGLLEQHPAVAKAVLLKVVSLVRFLSERLYEYGTLSVGGRVRAELLRLARQQNGVHSNMVVIENLPTHEELANRLATHREAITREIGLLVKNGIVQKHKSKLTILNLSELMTELE